MDFKNCLKLHKRSIRYYYFCFFDAPEYLAGGVFEKYNVPVEVLQEMKSRDYQFVAVLCRVRKRSLERFADAMDDLKAKMIICGYPGYEEFCNEFSEYCEKVKVEQVDISNGKEED